MSYLLPGTYNYQYVLKFKLFDHSKLLRLKKTILRLVNFNIGSILNLLNELMIEQYR